MKESEVTPEAHYRSLVSCIVPVGECPWSIEEHEEANDIVELLDNRDKRIAELEDEVARFRDGQKPLHGDARSRVLKALGVTNIDEALEYIEQLK